MDIFDAMCPGLMLAVVEFAGRLWRRYREIRAKMTPMTMALSSSAKMDCTTMTQFDSQQLLGLTSPYPAGVHITANGQTPFATV